MNINYLMQYLARRLHTIILRCSPDGELADSACLRIGFPEHVSFTALIQALLPQITTLEYPLIFTNRDSVSYAGIRTPESIFLIGPVLLTGSTKCKYPLPDDIYPPDKLAALYQCSAGALLNESLLLHNLFSADILSLDDVILLNCLGENTEAEIQRDFVNTLFSNQEAILGHNPYDQEVREISSIRNGDIEQLKKSWAEDYTGSLGILAKDPLRNYKNLGIVLVTLGSRAAIEGGVMPEMAYSLSDSYIRKIEEEQSPDAAIQLGRKAEYEYTLLVRDVKAQKKTALPNKDADSRVAHCKDYIFLHMHEKIRITDIASALFINANYLSELFKKQEGITIGTYILQEKIKLVQNMLVYSHYSYIEIAAYLGFSSQSHLGHQFKKVTGMTLHQYREKYGVKGF